MEQKVNALLILDRILIQYEDNVFELIEDSDEFINLCHYHGIYEGNVISRMTSLLCNEQNSFDILKYLIKFNYIWLKMNLLQWISNCNHPCPIITLRRNDMYHDKYTRINNYQKLQVDNIGCHMNNISIPLNFLDIMCECIESKDKFMIFQKNVDMYVLGMKHNLNVCSTIMNKKKITLSKLLNQNQNLSQNKYPTYLLQYINFKNLPNIYLLLQYCPITTRYMTKPNEITGKKIKIQIIKNHIHWVKYDILNNLGLKIWHYKLSKFITDHVINQEIIVGSYHYHYKYVICKCQDIIDGDIFHLYIDYKSFKPLKSIKEYYCNLSHYEINKLNQYFNYKTTNNNNNNNNILNGDFNHNYTTTNNDNDMKQQQWNISHKLWIGISIHYNLISNNLKNQIYNEINTWKIKCPTGIVCHKSRNRNKYFIGYRYFYRTPKMTTTDVNQASAMAGGLRNIENGSFIPKWLIKLIIYLKKIGFINNSDNINQIGINHYYNDHKYKNVYSGIDPHKEHDKFSVVYSLSIYGNSNSPSYLSFNLHSNKSNGDAKILMPDCCGLHCHIPSWSMSIVTHSVSFYECELRPNEWRIVLLFRNIWNKHIEFLKNNPNIKDPESKKTKKTYNNNNKQKKFIIKEQQEYKCDDDDDDEWNYDIVDTEDEEEYE